MTTQIYARIHRGRAIEMNVTKKQIVDRGDSMANYLPLYYDAPPKKIPAYHVAKQVTVVYRDHVRVTFHIEPMELTSLLLRIWHTDGDLRRPIPSVSIADLPASLIKAVSKASDAYMQKRLDEFAMSRGYEDIKSAVTYVDSVVPRFAADGARAKYIRDTTWAAFYAYQDEVLSGTKPVPKNIAEIVANCPALTWE